MKTQEPNEKKITIRIPDDLRAALVKAAKDDARSLNAEILTMLRAALVARK